MVITHHPNTLLHQSADQLGSATQIPAPRPSPPAPGSWRYRAPHTAWLSYLIAIALSAGFHAGVFYGVGRHKQEVNVAVDDKLNVMRIEMPDLKDLEEPEPVITESNEPVDIPFMPTLMDAPTRIAVATDFVQTINFASLVPAPDLNAAKVLVIPQRDPSQDKLLQSIGAIFNLADLDRVPVPVMQPAPIFPVAQRRSGQGADVMVEFIVDRDGKVLNPFVTETTNAAFNDAAVTGVARWRFRPGVKAGQKVNTRMSVPILFKITDTDI